jgi:hypothetical protein
VNDLIRLAAERAVRLFGDKGDGLFNGACFSDALCGLADVNGPVDGRIVRAILTGRRDIRVLKGGSHYRLMAARS